MKSQIGHRALNSRRSMALTRRERAGLPVSAAKDNIENRWLSEVRRALTPNGTLVLNSGTGAGGLRLLARLVRPVVLSPFVGHNLRRYLSTPNQAELQFLRALVERGQLRPVIDTTYPLSETAAALRHIETGRARGKVVVAVAA